MACKKCTKYSISHPQDYFKAFMAFKFASKHAGTPSAHGTNG